MVLESAGPNIAPNVSSGSPGSSRTLLPPPRSFTWKAPATMRIFSFGGLPRGIALKVSENDGAGAAAVSRSRAERIAVANVSFIGCLALWLVEQARMPAPPGEPYGAARLLDRIQPLVRRDIHHAVRDDG